jgi:hypothetical protein
MYDNRHASPLFVQQKTELLQRTVDCIFNEIVGGEAPSKLSVTVEEAMLVGVSKNLAILGLEPTAVLRAKYKKLTNDSEFSATPH